MKKLKLRPKETEIKVIPPYSNSCDMSTGAGFNFIFENANIKVIRGINPNFSHCIMSLEIIIDYKNKKLYYNLILDDFDKKDIDAIHDIINIPSQPISIENTIIETFKNEKFYNGETLLNYLIENNFILFESAGSYLIDEFYADGLYKRYYNCDLEDNISNTSLERSFIKYNSIYNN